MKVFCIYHNYSDGSGQPDIIYIGEDKAAAFDALWHFLKNSYTCNGEGLHMKTGSTPYMEQPAERK